MFTETRMSFGDHIEELRTYLWRAIYGFLIVMVGVFVLDALGTALGKPYIGVGRPVLAFIARPVEQQLTAFWDRRVKKVAERLAQKDPSVTAIDQPTDFLSYGFDAEQLRAVIQAVVDGQPLQGVNNFPKPVVEAKPDASAEEKEAARKLNESVVRLWIRVENPLKKTLAEAKAIQEVGKRPALTTLSAQEAFMVYFKVAIVSGIVLGSPWIFWQIWQFVAAGLYPHEKRYVHYYLPFSLGLFLGGVLLCEFIVIPRALEALLWFNEWIGLEPDLRLNEWLGFAIMMPLVFGLSFQTPLVMLFLERIGIFTVDAYRNKRRMAWFFMAIFAAIASPSIDAISMLFLWAPLGLLYELGIFLCRMSPRQEFDEDVPESEEMVEV
jgi:sec-independent protein translocase protein TatC